MTWGEFKAAVERQGVEDDIVSNNIEWDADQIPVVRGLRDDMVVIMNLSDIDPDDED
jgi:hypothetical protein